ncbi:unnamed protein product [Thlaspi arvense]|uniref:Agenet domain-containing protein n=1 Tax=Thlaspi arvense TaxID=13288 RepID=A0AAU9T642_THLAR|nr:unnamed protein product [Thlaspi arvense]
MGSITKDSEVEVSYSKNGFKGIWYRAILKETPTKSEHKLLRVRYKTLLKKDGSGPLSEIVDQRLIRPVPPEDLNVSGAGFEEGSLVNANYKNSWWRGVVVKRKEDDTYLVYFNSPPDIIQFERKQLRAHLDWTSSKWVRPKNTELVKSVFSSGTMVELRAYLSWRPAMIIKEVEYEKGKRFLVKYCDESFSCTGKLKMAVVDPRIVRPKQPLFGVGEYELLDRVEAFNGSVWEQGVVRGIVFEGRYMVSFWETKADVSQFNHSDLRPIMEWEDGIWYNRPKPKSGKETCKRKRGEVEEHNSDLNDTVLSSDQTPISVKSHAANVEGTQAKDTAMVLPFAKKSPIWKTYETMEVFKRVPQSPHFSPLLKTKGDFREGSAIGMMATFTGLLEKLRDLETDVSVSQLDSLRDSFTELEKHGFDVTRPLSRIKKLLALKDRQLNILEEQKGLDKERMDDEYSKMRKAGQEVSEKEVKMLEVKHKILELQKQEAALRERKETAKEEKDAANKNICEIESCLKDLDVELEEVEFDFESVLFDCDRLRVPLAFVRRRKRSNGRKARAKEQKSG